VSDNLHLVFSKPPASISDDQFNDWYGAHLAEILVVPGFEAARRYRLETVVSANTLGEFTFLSAYEIEGDPTQVMKNLDVEVASGRMDLPSWFPDIRFASFNCTTHGNDTEPALADHLYLVFSAPPAGVDDAGYVEFYREHAAENTRVPGFLRSWRFRLEPVVVDRVAPIASSHLALYEVDRDLDTLRTELRAAREVNEEHFPSWFGEIPFVSLDATALGSRVPAP
jgi:hypothetical protein